MLKRLKSILIISLLLATTGVMAQLSAIDKVCQGASRNYKVTGEPLSTYTWTITDPSLNVTTLPDTQDHITTIWSQPPGTYTLSIMQHGANGCDAMLQQGLIIIVNTPQAFAGNPQTICSFGTVQLSQATAANYSSLLWTTAGDGTFSNSTLANPAYTPGLADIAAGNVLLTLTANGQGNPGSCSPAVSQVSVSISTITAGVITTPTTCFGYNTGIITLSGSGGTAPYTYTLDGTTNTSGQFVGLAAGDHTYKIVDFNGCETIGTATVSSPSALTAVLTANPSDCFGSASGSISISNPAGGSGTYQYSIDSTNWSDTPIFSNLTVGLYTVYMRDNQPPACALSIGNLTITQPALQTANTSHTNVTIEGLNDGTITISNQSGGSGKYEYSIDGINWQSTTSFNNLAPGIYSVMMRDSLVPACSVILGDQIILEGLKVIITGQDITCYGMNNGQATAVVTGGTAPYTYLWNDPSAQTTLTAINLFPGIYTVTVTDAAGTKLSATDTITQSDGIVPEFNAIASLCLGSTAPALPATSLNGINGKWIPAAINTTVASTTIFTFTPLPGQCATTFSMTIQVSGRIVPMLAGVGPLCLNSTPPTLPATSLDGINGTWSPAVINTSIDTTLVYKFTPFAGQCAIPGTISIEVGSPEITSINAYTSTNGLANGYAIILTEGAAAASAFSLNGTDWQTSNVFNKLLAGTYTVWVRNDNGCLVSDQFTILNTIVGEVEVLAGDVASCISVPIEIPVMAYDFTNISAFTIQLSFDSTMMTFNGLTQMNTLLSDGSVAISLISPGTLQISFTSADSITLLSEDLLFNLNFIGLFAGKTEITWNWLECVVYSASGYEIPAVYSQGTVDIRPAPQIYTEGSGAYCERTPLKINSGSLTGQDLTYNWTSPVGETHFGPEWNLGPLSLADSGSYQIIASDSTKCPRTEYVQIQVNPNPVITIADHDTLCADDAIVLVPGAGFAGYEWQDGTTEPQLTATAEGMYWVIVSDYNGCKASDSVYIHPCQLLVWMPNAFSPNGDGLNDEFMAKYNLEVDFIFSMTVFNKWGEQIFSSNDIKKGWDGTFKGQPCPSDLYTWTISFKAPPTYNFIQKSPQRGNVMLLK